MFEAWHRRAWRVAAGRGVMIDERGATAGAGDRKRHQRTAGQTWGLDLLEESVATWAVPGHDPEPSMLGFSADDLIRCMSPALRTAAANAQVAEVARRRAVVGIARARAALAAHADDQEVHFDFAALQLGLAFAMTTEHSQTAPRSPRLGMQQALIASHAVEINVCNIDLSWAPYHEVLAAAAWLGVVRSGRPAVLSADIAYALIDYAAPERFDTRAEAWSSNHTLSALAAITDNGTGCLGAMAQAVADDGAAQIFSRGQSRTKASLRDIQTLITLCHSSAPYTAAHL